MSSFFRTSGMYYGDGCFNTGRYKVTFKRHGHDAMIIDIVDFFSGNRCHYIFEGERDGAVMDAAAHHPRTFWSCLYNIKCVQVGQDLAFITNYNGSYALVYFKRKNIGFETRVVDYNHGHESLKVFSNGGSAELTPLKQEKLQVIDDTIILFDGKGLRKYHFEKGGEYLKLQSVQAVDFKPANEGAGFNVHLIMLSESCFFYYHCSPNEELYFVNAGEEGAACNLDVLKSKECFFINGDYSGKYSFIDQVYFCNRDDLFKVEFLKSELQDKKGRDKGKTEVIVLLGAVLERLGGESQLRGGKGKVIWRLSVDLSRDLMPHEMEVEVKDGFIFIKIENILTILELQSSDNESADDRLSVRRGISVSLKDVFVEKIDRVKIFNKVLNNNDPSESKFFEGDLKSFIEEYDDKGKYMIDTFYMHDSLFLSVGVGDYENEYQARLTLNPREFLGTQVKTIIHKPFESVDFHKSYTDELSDSLRLNLPPFNRTLGVAFQLHFSLSEREKATGYRFSSWCMNADRYDEQKLTENGYKINYDVSADECSVWVHVSKIPGEDHDDGVSKIPLFFKLKDGYKNSIKYTCCLDIDEQAAIKKPGAVQYMKAIVADGENKNIDHFKSPPLWREKTNETRFEKEIDLGDYYWDLKIINPGLSVEGHEDILILEELEEDGDHYKSTLVIYLCDDNWEFVDVIFNSSDDVSQRIIEKTSNINAYDGQIKASVNINNSGYIKELKIELYIPTSFQCEDVSKSGIDMQEWVKHAHLFPFFIRGRNKVNGKYYVTDDPRLGIGKPRPKH
ncbi:hypothetical protein [Pseudoalteromonas rubra]|nr:hypothetical protein [Pseudoalteromonas rubra]